MGVAVRVEERERRRDEMGRLARALAKGLRDTRTIPVKDAVAALPKELITGGNRERLATILERYRRSLYPDNVKIDLAATSRVADAHKRRVYWRHRSTTSPYSIFQSLEVKCCAPRSRSGVMAQNPSSKESTSKSPWQFVSLVGPSGSGKTSILRAVSGLLTPRSGGIELNGSRDSLGFLFQDDALLPWRTARENVALGWRIRKLPTKAAESEGRRLAGAPRAGRFWRAFSA